MCDADVMSRVLSVRLRSNEYQMQTPRPDRGRDGEGGDKGCKGQFDPIRTWVCTWLPIVEVSIESEHGAKTAGTVAVFAESWNRNRERWLKKLPVAKPDLDVAAVPFAKQWWLSESWPMYIEEGIEEGGGPYIACTVCSEGDVVEGKALWTLKCGQQLKLWKFLRHHNSDVHDRSLKALLELDVGPSGTVWQEPQTHSTEIIVWSYGSAG